MSIGFSGMITQAQELSKKLPSVVELAKRSGKSGRDFHRNFINKNKNIVEVRFNNSGTESERIFLFLAIGFTIISIMGLWVCIVQLIRIRKQKKSKSGIRAA